MKNQNENQEKYEQGRRTRPENVLHDLPDRLAIITINPYTTAIGFGRYGKAYLQVLNPDKVSGLQLQGNAIYESGKFQALTDKEIQNMTSTRYEMIDLGLLRMFYSIILKEYEKVDFEKNSSDIVLYVPDLFRALGKKMNQSQNQIQALIEAINQFKNVLGVVIGDNGGRKYKSYYALLNFNYYDEERNVVSFSAPYLGYVVQTVHNASVRLDKNDRPIISKNGKAKVCASHSYLIKAEIVKERNAAAVENVNILVALIEQSGNKMPHISAATLVERNEILKQRLHDCKPRSRQQILARTFETTWKLMHTMTYLEDTYKDIVIPNPTDKGSIPKYNRLLQTVYEFPHKGKVRSRDD